MRIRTRVYRLQKAGNSAEEYEDACWPADSAEWCAGSFHCAVADGATETSFSGLWAHLLVEAWGRRELGERRLLARLPALGRAWRAEVDSRPLPWYAEEKVQSGAFSSLLGVSVTAHPDGVPGGRWRALAVGDTCLFHVGGDGLRRAFPLERSEQFDNRPHLLSSNPGANGMMEERLRRARGRWVPGDTILCMTDALAQWFLESVERCEMPWNAVQTLGDEGHQQSFDDWIGILRQKRLLRNDDVTLLVVTLCEERA
jgi:hypothetical protein